MTTEELAKRRAWAESHFGDKNLTDEELECATYMPSENFSDGWDKGSDYALSHQWIPVDERLPEPMQRVFVWIGDEALVCWYTKSGRFKTTLRSKERYSEDKSLHEKIHLSPCREDVTDVVTHWMDTPKLNPEKRKMITTAELSRMVDEYAKEIAPDNKEAQTAISADSLGFLDKVMEKCCLVEKSKIREAFKDAQKDQYNSEGDFALTLAGRNRSSVLIDLFPEIAKEVEG